MTTGSTPSAAKPQITVSVVSHGQGELVDQLLGDLEPFRRAEQIQLIITRNIPEQHQWRNLDELNPWTTVIDNPTPKGFGANHNAALNGALGQWSCIVNPDIRIPANVFPRLRESALAHGGALVSPAVLGPTGHTEDHAREFPSIFGLIRRRLGANSGAVDYRLDGPDVDVDWVAGMFMFLPTALFAHVGGFDEAYFMYCEDIDLCRRIRATGESVVVCPQVRVIHDARRASARNGQHRRWHMASMARYLATAPWGGRPSQWAKPAH